MDAERLRATLAATSALRTRVTAASGWRRFLPHKKHASVTLVGLPLVDTLLIAAEEFGRSAERDQLLAALPADNGDLNPIAAPIALAKVDLHGDWQDMNWRSPLSKAILPQIIKVRTGGYAIVLRAESACSVFVRAAGYSGICHLDTLVSHTDTRSLVVSTASGARYRRPQKFQPNHSTLRRLLHDSLAHTGLRQSVLSKYNFVTIIFMTGVLLAISAIATLHSKAHISDITAVACIIAISIAGIFVLHLYRQKNDWKHASSVVTDIRKIFLRSYLGQQSAIIIDVTSQSRDAAHQLISVLRLWILDIPVVVLCVIATLVMLLISGYGITISMMLPHICLGMYLILTILTRIQRVGGLLRILRALDANRHTVLERVRGDIALDGATYIANGSDEPLIKGLNIRIRAGERVGIIGSTGAGKTTLLRALAGQLALEKGRRYVDGQPRASTFDPVQREQISFSGLDTLIIHGSVSDNILMGRSTPLPGMIDWIVRACNMSSLLSRNSNGWQQIIDDVSSLSSGERQAIGLARALAGDPAILLLDEPTAMMDAQAEQAFLSAITNDSTRRTLIISSNRQNVLRLMDRIIWLDIGRIVADKPGTDLLQATTPKTDKHAARSAA
jgi:ABC-type multidrug transport system fused ATPase/permease subunit